jgi:hypothetical protein
MSHRVPVTWLRNHASVPIRLRTLTEILPAEAVDPDEVAALRTELLTYKGVTQVEKKQRSTGIWAANILGIEPSKSLGIKDIGTVSQYRRLLELGAPTTGRALQLTNRVLFRLLSRDDDPKLLFEYQKSAKTNPDLVPWARGAMHEAATAALAQGGLVEDPRVRGAAKRVANALSDFLRTSAADKPIVKKGAKNILNPDAHAPTLYSVALIAYMPALQRERAGFIERLQQFLAKPAPKRPYVVVVGNKSYKPTTQILGDPLQNDSVGRPRDLPFALHWIELLARMKGLRESPSAQRALTRLLKDCDDHGVWSAKSLRSFPKSPSGLAGFYFPLEVNEKSAEARRADVTFRLAHLAKLAGLELEFR